MSRIKEIRDRLKLTQLEFGEAIGCTQGNVGHLERGQTLMPNVAERVIALSAARGLQLSMDQVYGREPMPPQSAAANDEHKARA